MRIWEALLTHDQAGDTKTRFPEMIRIYKNAKEMGRLGAVSKVPKRSKPLANIAFYGGRRDYQACNRQVASALQTEDNWRRRFRFGGWPE